jgi:hypothetical protein
MAGRGRGPDFVEALARGLDILASFGADHRGMSLSEVAAAAGLTTAGEISAEWAIWLSRPHVVIARRGESGSVTA